MTDSVLSLSQAGKERAPADAEIKKRFERQRVRRAGIFAAQLVVQPVRNWFRRQLLTHESGRLVHEEILSRFPHGTTRASLEVNVFEQGVRVVTHGDASESQEKLYYTHPHNDQDARIRLLVQGPGSENRMVTESNVDSMTVLEIHHALSALKTQIVMSRHPTTHPDQPG